MPPKVFRAEEINAHVTETDLWFVYKGRVYDVTKFVDQHPGGMDTLLGVAGQDGTTDFDSVGHSDTAKEDLEKYYIGEIHPEDKDKLGVPKHEQKSSMNTVYIILAVIAILAYFIVKP
ncbi:cytochrome b5 [Angomonas deanei]|uniref:Cytochrome b5-like Heme/Steroid binding domain containing protein, putative n=1 Tax=Angomonas deanei TaxID=59799 RepID=S9VRC4_9TRYP|nr:cytochrome b5 [Angomonas deanei]EPY38009.1 cytochrome b5 [Angomonas deanei]EPY40652.1 cytochrome b5 [Angomonas deanei]EPY43493.1 cytochrome b5 [Angomonas deanei]CAD2219252.1 Cytochrome b5-like Heme/Steroid binding domain containing protein, putative [Angomonas deanei]|eukprot:EPY36563.1 cytochrome b5 [Angomonas deanei]